MILPEKLDISDCDLLLITARLQMQILGAAKAVYPDLQMEVHTYPSLHSNRPMYLGKRHISHDSHSLLSMPLVTKKK